MPGSHSEVSNRMYIESSDGGLTWSETQAPKGKEFGVFFDESRGRYFNILNIGESAWFFDCGTSGEFVEKTQICPWWLEINAEPLIIGNRILMPVTLRTSSSQNFDPHFELPAERRFRLRVVLFHHRRLRQNLEQIVAPERPAPQGGRSPQRHALEPRRNGTNCRPAQGRKTLDYPTNIAR